MKEKNFEEISYKLSLALHSAKIGIWEWSLNTNTSIWDDRMYEIYGIDKTTSITYDMWKNCVFPEEREKAEASLSETINNKTRGSVSFSILRKDGAIRYIISSHDVAYDKLGNITTVIGTNIDITENKEKDILISQQSKMAVLGEMINNISHQWKTPLSLISMSNNFLKISHDNDDFSDPNEINKAVNNIHESVEFLSSSIDDFRNFFKPYKQKQYFKLDYIIEKIDKLLITQFKDKNFEIIKEIENIEIFAYENELLQVLINILKNVRDALVKIINNKILLFIEVSKKEDFVLISIKDNAGNIQENVSDSFFTEYSLSKEEDAWTGIGLYMSKKIIEDMNGSVEVKTKNYTYKNKDYLGTEYKIYLPL